MELTAAENMAKAEIEKHGLADWSFKFDYAKSRFGQCNYCTRTIKLSRTLTELNPPERVLNTIKHEIAHALTFGAGHGRRWKNKCIEIGCEPRRTYPETVAKPPRKYKGTCPSCGKVVYKHRRRDTSCGACSTSYDPKYKFVWTISEGYQKPGEQTPI